MTEPKLPEAVVTPAPRRSLAWILPVMALALTVFLMLQAFGERGQVVTVTALEGHGIEAGDALTYRGIDVGRVTAVQLTRGLDAVELTIRLDPGSEDLARAGSQFWVVRPQVSLDSVQGLETVVGARYLSVLPGPSSAPQQDEFVALEEPPVGGAFDAGALEVLLEADERFGLTAGAPVTYRGIQVGSVLSVALSSDATIVEVRARIEGPFAALVREGTQFWEVGGFEVDASLTGGLEVAMDSIRSILVGGVAFATPDTGGPRVSTGRSFPLHSEPEDAWLAWKPAMALGSALLPEGSPMPRPVRAVQRWKPSGLLSRKRSRPGWLLAVEGGVIGPRNLLTPVEGTSDAGTQLELRGRTLDLAAPEAGEALLVRVDLGLDDLPTWAASRTRTLTGPEACLIVGDPGRDPRGLSATRVGEVIGGGAPVNDAIGFDENWHGATVVARSDGAVVGLLVVGEGGTRIAPLP